MANKEKNDSNSYGKSQQTEGKTKIWKASTGILAVLLVVSLYFLLQGGTAVTGAALGPQDAGDKAVNYINQNLLNQGTAELVDVKEEKGLYLITLDIGGQEQESYITKDGELLLPQSVELKGGIPNNQPDSDQQDTDNGQNQPTRQEVSLDDDPVKGSEDAPVTIIEFSDFECPYCSKYYSQTLPQIEENYVKTGKVKIVYKDFPLTRIHPDAMKAAQAAECAQDQGNFWEYHDKMFENQDSLGVSSLKQYAQDLGLDTEEFNTCLDSGKYESEVQNDLQQGQSAGISGTPGFLINGRLVTGAQPYANFKQIIEEELN